MQKMYAVVYKLREKEKKIEVDTLKIDARNFPKFVLYLVAFMRHNNR